MSKLGLMYTSDNAFNDNGKEYIVMAEINTLVALMDTDTQEIRWVTANTLLSRYTKKVDTI